jgi:hypothetical protein
MADKAASYACRAADRAMRMRAYEEAVRLYWLALAELERSGEYDRARKCAVLVDLGVAQNASGTLEVSKRRCCKQRSWPRYTACATSWRGDSVVGAMGEEPDVDPVHVGLIESVEAWEGTGTTTEAALLARLAMALRFSAEHARRDAASLRASILPAEWVMPKR